MKKWGVVTIFVLFLACGCNGDLISELQEMYHCSIPEDANDTTKTLLAEQCMSKEHRNDTVCYEELGCFDMSYPWVSLKRPVPPPMNPKLIHTRLYLSTRKQPSRYAVQLWPNISLKGSDYDPSRPYNVFITHGFIANENFTFKEEITVAYLKQRNANVFIVDWADGAKLVTYGRAVSNTRVVAMEITRFIMYLMENYGLKPESVHLIGHSLGAHISGYVGKNLGGKVGHITGLDAAQPAFEDTDEKVHLTKADGLFVEAIHTNGLPFLTLVDGVGQLFLAMGLGFVKPLGHVDIYVNAGGLQPDCFTRNRYKNLNLTNSDIKHFINCPIAAIGFGFESTCSHLKAVEYYLEALKYTDCVFWSRLLPLPSQLFWPRRVYPPSCLVIPGSGLVTPVNDFTTFTDYIIYLSGNKDCTLDTCLPMNLEIQSYPARGIFALNTKNANKPQNCEKELDATKEMADARTRKRLMENNRCVCENTSVKGITKNN